MSQNEGREKLDATGEFFSVGAPLHAVRAGYVKRRADDLLFETVSAGRYAHVVAPDRSGKSSLIAATAARLETNGVRVAILDLEQIGVRDGGTDSGRWYYSVAYRLLRQLRIRYDLQNWWQDKSILSNRQRLVEFYSEVVLQHVTDRVVVFVDEIQCIEDRPYADELLASIRAAHNARTTDPDFSRLSFVMSGECDPVNLVEEPELSPFNVTQQIVLDDFERAELDLFATELNLDPASASVALDRIFYWTNGQPYLSQKLARAIAREAPQGDVEAEVDHIALHQLAGRAALHSEPHMSHIHRRLVSDSNACEPLLNLYGKLRKGIEVAADLGSATQRRLMAVGLVLIDPDGNLAVRNRLYGAVFTTRWANENLPTKLRVPLMVVSGLVLFALIPFWYTQWLPGPYLRVLADDTTDISIAAAAYENFASFPGHTDTALNLYRQHLERRAQATADVSDIHDLAARMAALPDAGRLPEEIEAGFWDRHTATALLGEQRDEALIATLRSLALSTTVRRRRAAALVSDDYPLLQATLPALQSGTTVFDAQGLVLTTAVGADIFQWSWAPQGLQQREPWSITALEVSPLVRRVMVDRQGTVNRIGLTLNISHGRLVDLRVKIIAPSGRAVEIETGLERASSGDDIRVSPAQLQDFIGESLSGTWSISVRDEALGVAGQLVGWNLKLNSQGAVEHFQRGLNIPEPIERETDNVWFDRSGRYAVARAMQSDSARIWDLSFAEPVRAVAVSENESLIGIDANARHLVTATQDSVNIWDTATGDKVQSLAVGAASAGARLTADGSQLFVVRRGDVETVLQLWSLESGVVAAEISVAGAPAHVSIDSSASRVAIADFDRAVRVWEFATGELLAQLGLAMQPSEIKLSADGGALGALYAESGLSLWNVADPKRAVLEESGNGRWHLEFSPSGALVAAGRPGTGFRVYGSLSGRLAGPSVGMRHDDGSVDLLAFAGDEQMLLTGSDNAAPRLWRVPPVAAEEEAPAANQVWNPSADRALVATPDGRFVAIGDPAGHVYVLPSNATIDEAVTAAGDINYLGHTGEVRRLTADPSSRLVASVDDGNSLRVWRVANGEPLPWITDIPGTTVGQMAFSPDASLLALLSGSQATIIDVASGDSVAMYDLGDPIGGLSFAADDRLYLGTDKGALQRVQRSADAAWHLQQVWQGDTGIRLLQASPRGDYLVLVDADNKASQFVLADGRIAAAALHLPSPVEEVVFDPVGPQAWFRTPRWAHAVTTSMHGLVWNDAMLVPQPLNGAGIVFQTDAESGVRRPVLPAAGNGFVELVDVGLVGSDTSGLFGSRDDLLRDWQARISANHPAAF